MHQDGPEDETAPSPQLTRLVAENAAIVPLLNAWLLLGRPGVFLVERDPDGALMQSATLSDAPESQIVPYIVPGN